MNLPFHHPNPYAVREMRPYAAPHTQKKACWQMTATVMKEAAARDPNVYVRAKADCISRSNLWKRIDQLKKAHKKKMWESLRRSGSEEEYNHRIELMDDLVMAMEAADMKRKEAAARKVAEKQNDAANGKSLLGALYARAANAGVLAKRGKEHAAAAGVQDHTHVKKSTPTDTHEVMLAHLDKAQEDIRSANDKLGHVEEAVDKAVEQVAAVLDVEERSEAVDERLKAVEGRMGGVEEMIQKMYRLMMKQAEEEQGKE